jgi:NADH:ubiquinone oxidoreductase subunit F (NADH-binding)
VSTRAAVRKRTGGARILCGLHPERALTFDEHLRAYGALKPHGRGLLDTLEASGLNGRGGAAFSVRVKVRAVALRRRRPVVVVNGVEAEPTSGKDKLLLRRLPHLVLDGAVTLASALDAHEVIIVVSRSSSREADALRAALTERPRIGQVRLRLASVPDGFVSGQETAVIQYLNGGPAQPTTTPPRPYESGVGKRPTLVQNVETVAQIALLDRFGAEWFRELGTDDEPGSRLFTISGAVDRPGVYEAEVGSRLTDLVAAAGGALNPPRAFLIGGYAGAWIDAGPARSLMLDEASLDEHGGTLGVGAVVVLPEYVCGICESARVARYLSDQSSGQCGPCVYGLSAIAERLEQTGRRRIADDQALLRGWAGQVTGRGACRHPDGAARFVLSALRVFEPELNRHHADRCTRGRHLFLPLPERRA